jgi:uncharacterized protein YlxW (UPF0749 family)
MSEHRTAVTPDMATLFEEAAGVPAAVAPISRATRAAFAVVLGLLAALLVTAAQSPLAPTGVRSGRRVALAELIEDEQRRVDALAATVAVLNAEVAAYQQTGGGQAERLAALRARIDEVASTVGLGPVRGPGLVTTLEDSPLPSSPTGDPNDLVIHEQDLQAVINALWAGGAEAMAVNGQRVLATTAIRCIGNTLLLHGRQYSPPYVIEAVGDPGALHLALDRDLVVTRLRHAALKYQLGFAVADAAELEFPPSEDLGGLNQAHVVAAGAADLPGEAGR